MWEIKMETQYKIIEILVRKLGKKLNEEEVELIHKLDVYDNKVLLNLFQELTSPDK